ncbi:MAG: type II secretion system F family protein [Limisphaerales bacterium]
MAFIVLPGQLERRAELYQQIALTIASGLPLPRAIRGLAEKPVSGSFRGPLLRVADRLDGGDTLAEAVGRLGGWMPEFDRAMIGAGELSGRLDETLRLLARSCRDRAASLRAMINGLIYPVAVFHVAALVFPTELLRKLFWDGAVGPFLARKAGVLLPAYAAVLLLAWASQGARGRAVRSVIETVFGLLPVIGGAMRALALARLSLALEALLNAGVAVTRAWPLAAAASGSSRLQRAVQHWPDQLEAGRTPAELIGSSGTFPGEFASLYGTGEVSGRVDEILPQLGAYYQEVGERKMRRAAVGFAWLVYGLAAAMAAFQIISFWTGYYGGLLGGDE